MSELTVRNRNSLVAVVVILTCFMLGFHYESIMKGIFPDYSFEPTDVVNQCGPQCLKEYVSNYQKLR